MVDRQKAFIAFFIILYLENNINVKNGARCVPHSVSDTTTSRKTHGRIPSLTIYGGGNHEPVAKQQTDCCCCVGWTRRTPRVE